MTQNCVNMSSVCRPSTGRLTEGFQPCYPAGQECEVVQEQVLEGTCLCLLTMALCPASAQPQALPLLPMHMASAVKLVSERADMTPTPHTWILFPSPHTPQLPLFPGSQTVHTHSELSLICLTNGASLQGLQSLCLQKAYQHLSQSLLQKPRRTLT